MGHAHIKHQDRLFMHDPSKIIDKSTIGSGIIVKSKNNTIL